MNRISVNYIQQCIVVIISVKRIVMVVKFIYIISNVKSPNPILEIMISPE